MTVPVQPPLSEAGARDWLSDGRLQVYLRAAGGDLDPALELYVWNTRVTAACSQDLGHLEVALRNAYDRQLSRVHPNWTIAPGDLFQLETGLEKARQKQRLANAQSRKILDEARRRSGPQRTHGHIIANLSFGFWKNLTLAERESTIWTPMLSHVFPGRRRGPLHNIVRNLNDFRNRLAHWEPTFSRTSALSARLHEIDELLTALDPQLAAWIGRHSVVGQTLHAQPLPVLDLANFPGRYLDVRLRA